MDLTIFGYTFRNAALLEQALTMPSVHLKNREAEDNQRLEFLGDTVLQMLATVWLYETFPTEQEGLLTSRRQNMVSTAALCAAVEKTDFLSRLSCGGVKGLYSPHSKPIADAVEAVFGAAWLDGGMAAAQTVFQFLKLENCAVRSNLLDAKSRLQIFSQALKPARMPAYDLIRRVGSSDKPTFTVRASVEGYGAAEAEGRSLKEAERAAAEILLERVAPTHE